MKYGKYVRHAKNIAASDSGSIIDRWRLGRALLTDPEATTPAGHLKHGVLARLIAKWSQAGVKLTQTEVSRCLRCGKAYPSEAEISRATTDFGNWWALVEKGFPPVEVTLDADTGSFDPRTDQERARDAVRELVRQGTHDDGLQLALFELFREAPFTGETTVGEARAYMSEMRQMTERFARKDREREEYVARLEAAVNGDLSATIADAHAAMLAAEKAA